jgi:hypothetical protein
MDEIKELINLINQLPTIAVWVLMAYLVYKLAVIGSVYGLIRFGIDKLHDWLVSPKTVTVKAEFGGIGIFSETSLSHQLQRVIAYRGVGPTNFFGSVDAGVLTKAIDEYIANHPKK